MFVPALSGTASSTSKRQCTTRLLLVSPKNVSLPVSQYQYLKHMTYTGLLRLSLAEETIAANLLDIETVQVCLGSAP